MGTHWCSNAHSELAAVSNSELHGSGQGALYLALSGHTQHGEGNDDCAARHQTQSRAVWLLNIAIPNGVDVPSTPLSRGSSNCNHACTLRICLRSDDVWGHTCRSTTALKVLTGRSRGNIVIDQVRSMK